MENTVELKYTGHKAAIFVPSLNAEIKNGETITVSQGAAENLLKLGSFETITKKETKKKFKTEE